MTQRQWWRGQFRRWYHTLHQSDLSLLTVAGLVASTRKLEQLAVLPCGLSTRFCGIKKSGQSKKKHLKRMSDLGSKTVLENIPRKHPVRFPP